MNNEARGMWKLMISLMRALILKFPPPLERGRRCPLHTQIDLKILVKCVESRVDISGRKYSSSLGRKLTLPDAVS